MSAHDSQLPGEEKPKTIRIDATGGSMSWKGWGVFVGTILLTLAGGGSYVGFQFVTEPQLQASEKKQEAHVKEVKENVEIRIGGLEGQIGDLGEKVDNVQDVQVKNAARQEARRITEPIRNRDERERQYDRIRDLNEKRIKKGGEPCATLQCPN